MDLRRQLAIARVWLPLLVASVVLASVGAFAVGSLQQKVYEAKATLIVGASLSALNPNYDQLLVSQNLATTYASVAATRPILDAVIRKLDLKVSTDQLATSVQARAQISSSLLTITAQNVDPALAAAIANAIADQLIAASPTIQGQQVALQQSVSAQLRATEEQINATQAEVERLGALSSPAPSDIATLQTLQSQLVTLRSTYASLVAASSSNASNLLSVVEPAVAPITPVSPRPLLDALLGGILGLLIAAGFVYVVETLNDTVRDPDAVQDVVSLSTLGMISRIKGDQGDEIHRLVALLHPHSEAAEAYRTLRTNIEFASVDAPIRTLLVTSSIPSEGKTVTAANLALVFAQSGRRVLLVDADLRKPGVHTIFDLPNTLGLTTLLRSDEVSLDAIAHQTEQDNLRVLTTGPLPPNPAELLGSQRMRGAIERLQADTDLLVMDSPPIRSVADSAILSSFVDGTLFVIDAERSHRPIVREGRDSLSKAGANVLGAVLNRVPTHAGSRYPGYYLGGYGSAPGPKKAPDSVPERPLSN